MVDDDNIKEDNGDEEHLVSLRYSRRRLDIDLRAAVVLLVSGNT